MADGVLSFPFRISPQGEAVTAPYGSDQEVEEALALLVLTLAGERVMHPDYGVPDPTWAGITENDIQSGVLEYGPSGIEIESLDERPLDETTSTYVVNWTRETPEVTSV